MGGVFNIGRVSLHPRIGGPGSFPKDFQIQVSDDDGNWTTLVNRNDENAVADAWNHYDFTSTPTRYVQVLLTEPGFVGKFRTVHLAGVQIFKELPDGVELTFTAVGDNGNEGTAMLTTMVL